MLRLANSETSDRFQGKKLHIVGPFDLRTRKSLSTDLNNLQLLEILPGS
jgi:hypothetical protein